MYVINIPHLRWVCTGLGKKAFLVSFQNYPKQVTKRRKKKKKRKKKNELKQQQHWIYCWFLGQARVAGKALNRKPPNHPQLFSIITVCFVFTTTKKKNGKLNDKNPPPPPISLHSHRSFAIPSFLSSLLRTLASGAAVGTVSAWSALSRLFFLLLPSLPLFCNPHGACGQAKKNAKVKIYK